LRWLSALAAKGIMVTKRNHYVPRFYLEHFLTPGAKTFFVYYKADGRVVPQTPIDTAAENYLYTYTKADGSKDDSLETQVFCPVENLAKPVLDRWRVPGASIEIEDIPRVSPFLSFIHTRVPRQIEIVKELGVFTQVRSIKQLAEKPEEIEKFIAYLRRQNDPNIPTVSEMQDLCRNVDKHVKLAANTHPAVVMSISLSEKINELLLRMNWALCEASGSIKFITCDSPFVSFVPDHDGHAMFGANFMSPDIVISFPISPEVCLIIYRNGSPPPKHSCGLFVREINRRTAFMAEGFLLSPFRSKYIRDLAKEFAFTLGKPKLDYEAMEKHLGARDIFQPPAKRD